MNGGGLTTDMEEIVAGVSKALAALDKEVDDAA
jgi:ribosomal protein S9